MRDFTRTPVYDGARHQVGQVPQGAMPRDLVNPAIIEGGEAVRGQLDAMERVFKRNEDAAQAMEEDKAMREVEMRRMAEFNQRLQLANGAEGSFFEEDGTKRETEFKNFISEYQQELRDATKGGYWTAQVGQAAAFKRDARIACVPAQLEAARGEQTFARGKKAFSDSYNLALAQDDYQGAKAAVDTAFAAGLISGKEAQKGYLAIDKTMQARELDGIWRGVQGMIADGDFERLEDAWHSGQLDGLPADRRAKVRHVLNNTPAEGKVTVQKAGAGRIRKVQAPPEGLPVPVANAWALANSGETLSPEQLQEVNAALAYFANYTITDPDDESQQEMVRQMGKQLKVSSAFAEQVIKESVGKFGGTSKVNMDAFVDQYMKTNGALLPVGVTREDFHASNARIYELRRIKAENGGAFKGSKKGKAHKAELAQLELAYEQNMRRQKELVDKCKAQGMAELARLMLINPDASYTEQSEAFIAGFSRNLQGGQMAVNSAYARMVEQIRFNAKLVEDMREGETKKRRRAANEAEMSASWVGVEHDVANVKPTAAELTSVSLGMTNESLLLEDSREELLLYAPKDEAGFKDGANLTVRANGCEAQVKVRVKDGISAPLLSMRALRALKAGGDSTGRLIINGYKGEADFLPGLPPEDEGLDPQGVEDLEAEEAVPVANAGIFAGDAPDDDPLLGHEEPLNL